MCDVSTTTQERPDLISAHGVFRLPERKGAGGLFAWIAWTTCRQFTKSRCRGQSVGFSSLAGGFVVDFTEDADVNV